MKVNVFKPPCLQYVSAKLPPHLISALLNDANYLCVAADKMGYEKSLVGSFHNGEQIAIQPAGEKMVEGFESFKVLAETKLQLADTFVSSYYSDIPKSRHRPFDTSISDIWLNVQKEGDFNPVHNHNCINHKTGISCFVWLQFPAQVLESSKTASEKAEHRGMTYLHWGSTMPRYSQEFQYPKEVGLMPVEGVLIMFPSWLEHVVYPFSGPGKRISIATNINVDYK